MSGRVVVIGVGNEHRRDDGAALAVLRALDAEDLAVDRLCLCDGEPTRLMELWDGADLAVVVDAVHGHPGRPGRLHVLAPGGTAPGADRTPAAGTHGLGLGDAVALAGALDRLPGALLVVAVEGADFSLGEGLSPPVADAVPRAVAAVRRAVEGHRRGEAGSRAGQRADSGPAQPPGIR